MHPEIRNHVLLEAIEESLDSVHGPDCLTRNEWKQLFEFRDLPPGALRHLSSCPHCLEERSLLERERSIRAPAVPLSFLLTECAELLDSEAGAIVTLSDGSRARLRRREGHLVIDLVEPLAGWEPGAAIAQGEGRFLVAERLPGSGFRLAIQGPLADRSDELWLLRLLKVPESLGHPVSLGLQCEAFEGVLSHEERRWRVPVSRAADRRGEPTGWAAIPLPPELRGELAAVEASGGDQVLLVEDVLWVAPRGGGFPPGLKIEFAARLARSASDLVKVAALAHEKEVPRPTRSVYSYPEGGGETYYLSVAASEAEPVGPSLVLEPHDRRTLEELSRRLEVEILWEGATRVFAGQATSDGSHVFPIARGRAHDRDVIDALEGLMSQAELRRCP